MNVDETPAVAESVVDDAQAEITDPDDIDALLESMDVDVAPAVAEPAADDAQAEITDPDDIDALLESMDIDIPNSSTPSVDEGGADEVLLESDSSDASAGQVDVNNDEISENKTKIEALTQEYVAPLLSADFSDILSKNTTEELIEPELAEADDFLEETEEFDIDDLIANVGQENSDIIEAKQAKLDEEALDIDDLESQTFDEETLADLLADKGLEPAIELSPDFSDQNVLADLLNDSDAAADTQVSEANEINDIQELDNLDFDELLANIEEESNVAKQPVDFNQNLDIGDEITLEDFDNFNADTSTTDSDVDLGLDYEVKDEGSYVSVDSLLDDSQDVQSKEEPYDKANIDVGLNDYPEFAENVNQIDVDLDENGVAAKLDLAKVYLEIGDEDNAQVILKEVLKLGDPIQQAEAKGLLNDL